MNELSEEKILNEKDRYGKFAGEISASFKGLEKSESPGAILPPIPGKRGLKGRNYYGRIAYPFAMPLKNSGLMAVFAEAFINIRLQLDDDSVAEKKALEGNIVQASTASSRKRLTHEIASRLKHLTHEEMVFFGQCPLLERKLLLWLALCRKHQIIALFTRDVLATLYSLQKKSLANEELRDFFYKNLNDFEAPETAVKKKCEVFRRTFLALLADAGFIDRSKKIRSILPTAEFQEFLKNLPQGEQEFFPGVNF